MEQLITKLNNSSEYQPNVILDLNRFNKSQQGLKIDLLKASLPELSSIIVSDMIKSVKLDLSSLKVETKEKSK